jgi:choline dehydrogenase-like flavoprotein
MNSYSPLDISALSQPQEITWGLPPPLFPPRLVCTRRDVPEYPFDDLFPGGSVTLHSSNPLDAPLINPNIMGSEVDMFIMRESLRASLRFAAAPAWAGYVIEPVHFNSSSTDTQLDTFIRSNAGTVYHPVGTAAMSPKTAKYGVVNPDLRVKGVSGLRVVDLSVLVRSFCISAVHYA